MCASVYPAAAILAKEEEGNTSTTAWGASGPLGQASSVDLTPHEQQFCYDSPFPCHCASGRCLLVIWGRAGTEDTVLAQCCCRNDREKNSVIQRGFHLACLNKFFSKCHSKQCKVKVSAPCLGLAVGASAHWYPTASWSCCSPGQQPSPPAALHEPALPCSADGACGPCPLASAYEKNTFIFLRGRPVTWQSKKPLCTMPVMEVGNSNVGN